MSWNPTATLTTLQTTLDATGQFTGGVQIGEPFSPPNDLTLAIMARKHSPSQATLSATIDVWTVQLRLYARAGMTPPDAQRVELNVLAAYASLETALTGAFTLGGNTRAIDWYGEEAGHRVESDWGHVVISGTIFRVVDVVLPLIIDDAATFAP